MESSRLSFTKSNQEKVIAVIDSRTYHFHYRNPKNFTAYFKCTDNGKIKCKGRLIVYNFNLSTLSFDKFIESTKHRTICEPCQGKVIKRRARALAKEIVQKDVNVKTSRVISMVENEVLEDPEDAGCLGKNSQFKRVIRRAKKTAKGEQYIGTDRVNFVLPVDLKLTYRGDRFLLEDIPGQERQVTFASDEMIRNLADCNVWLVGGTFKLAPTWFKQVFTIHGLYIGACMPAVYSLLPGKKEAHYERTLNALVSSGVSPLQPEYIICDFEVAIINACRKHFPLSKMSGCLFHLTKNLLKRVKSENLFIKYANDRKFKTSVRSLAALAFVPPNDVYYRFNTLRSNYAIGSDERKIISYFYDNYIGYNYDEVAYPIQFWNCYDRFVGNIPRTNNDVEGWHYKINSELSGSHPNLWACVHVFKTEQNSWENNIHKIRSGLGETQTLKYKRLDIRLKTIVDSYNTVLGELEYLKAISECLYDYLN